MNFIELRRGLWVRPDQVILVRGTYSGDATPMPQVILQMENAMSVQTIRLEHGEDPYFVAEEMMRYVAELSDSSAHSIAETTASLRRSMISPSE